LDVLGFSIEFTSVSQGWGKGHQEEESFFKPKAGTWTGIPSGMKPVGEGFLQREM
jgi:hypothetical protein